MQMKTKIWPCIILIVSALDLPAEEKKSEFLEQEKWSNVFGGREFTLHFVLSVPQQFTGKVCWQYVSNGRTIARGERGVAITAGRPEPVEIRLEAPPVKDGVVWQTTLSVSAMEQGSQKEIAKSEKTLWVFCEDPFAFNREWLKNLNVTLFDPDGKTTGIFKKAGMPFRETRNVSVLSEIKEGMIVVAEGISFREYRGLSEAMLNAAARGVPVLCLGAAGGEIQVPGIGESALPQPARVVLRKNDIIRTLDKRLDASSWCPGDRAVVSSLMLRGERGAVTGEVTLNENGWPWVELAFDKKGETLVICGFGLVKSWEASPTPRYLLVRLLEYVSGNRLSKEGESE